MQALATYPPVKEDIALIVDSAVEAADLLATVRRAGGELLEEARIFDHYVGDSIPTGTKSLAFALRFRAPDRTLTAPESAKARDEIVAAAEAAHGARLRA